MKLSDLLQFEKIVIQCHDNPDADALASGYAVLRYLKSQGKDAEFIYSGRNIIRKSNLVLMVKALEIPVRHVDTIEEPDLLVTVDCQYGEGNVTRLKAKNIAVIDHHIEAGELPELSIVRNKLGSCSTLIWSMLLDEGYDLSEDRKLSTALYYGLYTDTSELTEISQPLDKELRDTIEYDDAIIARFRNCNMSLEELEVAGTALLKSDYIEEQRIAIVKAAPCDPNVLGIISDLVLEVDAIDIVVVFCVQPNGVKLSVRSCVREVKASELAEEICAGVGSGGGHLRKAGGFISIDRLIPEYVKICEDNRIEPRMVFSDDGKSQRPSDSAIKTFIEKRAMDYFKNTTIIYGFDSDIDSFELEEYVSRTVPLGYIPTERIAEHGEVIKIRTVDDNKDKDIVVGEDSILITLGGNDIIEISKLSFEILFRAYPDWKYKYNANEPIAVRNNTTGKTIALKDYVSVCVPLLSRTVKAAKVNNKVKVFSDKEDAVYITGKPGDILVKYDDRIAVVSEEEFEDSFKTEASKDNEIKAVIFDLDGTLLDTLEDLKNAVNYALSSNKMPERTLDEVRQFVGNGVRKLMIRAVPEGDSNPKFEETFRLFKEYYKDHCKDNTGPYEGIMFLMEELKARGIKMGIVSNKFDSAVKELDKEYFEGYTLSAIGEMQGVERKPAADTALKAMKELGVEPGECIYVGDSDVDIKTAINAHIPCVSVTWGFRDKEFLIQNGATTIIDSPYELLKYL